MIKEIRDTYTETDLREVTFRYDPNNDNDAALLREIHNLIFDKQPKCENCNNYYLDGYFCGYRASRCKVHGNIEAFNNPHFDMDGSKCVDYERKKENIDE